MGLKSEVWKGKTVLVTGHTGFKGSWLVVLLKALGADVVGISLPPPPGPSLYEDAGISGFLKHELITDIREMSPLRSFFQEVQVDYVFHLAAQALVRKSLLNPLETISTNVIGTANVLVASLESELVAGITVATTDKVYKNKGWVWSYRENDQLGGDDPYSASKAACELIVNSISTSNNKLNIPITTVRAGNVVGGGDWAEDRLIPDLVRAIKSSMPIEIRYPNSTRPWQYILDCLSGYVLVAQAHLENKTDLPNSVNFGPDTSLSVSEVIEVFELALRVKIPKEISKSTGHEQNRLSLDSHLAKEVLNWEPKLSPYEAINRTADWYQSYLSGHPASELMNKEIKAFMEEN